MNHPELLVPLISFLFIVTLLGGFALKRENDDPRD